MCMRGLIWVHLWADIGLRERAVMRLESRAVSAQVMKHYVTIFSKACNERPIKHTAYLRLGVRIVSLIFTFFRRDKKLNNFC